MMNCHAALCKSHQKARNFASQFYFVFKQHSILFGRYDVMSENSKYIGKINVYTYMYKNG